MTVAIAPSPTPTAFDKAYNAAVAAGWPGRCAFDACVLMKASGLAEQEIERLFRACMRWLQ